MPRLIDADKLMERLAEEQRIHMGNNAYLGGLADAGALIAAAPTVAMGDDHITINWTPDIDRLARDVAYQGLNEFSFLGKSIAEWAGIILEQPRWVSVNDRLPNTPGPYLTLRGGQLMPPASRMSVYYWTGKEGCYWRGMEGGSRIVGITHWMDLPKPPKG